MKWDSSSRHLIHPTVRLYIAHPNGGVAILQRAKPHGYRNHFAFSQPNGTLSRISGNIPGDTIDKFPTDKLIMKKEWPVQRINYVRATLQTVHVEPYRVGG